MKKIIVFLTLITTIVSAQPIAVKSLGTDSLTGLAQRISIWQLTIDSKAEKVVVVYDIETLSPNGKVVATSPVKTYERTNKPAVMNADTVTTPANLKFNELRASQVGQMISGMIAADLVPVITVNDLGKLEQ